MRDLSREPAGPFVGTAGWSIPAAAALRFPGEGTHLVRFGRRLDAVEINSSFYRPHRRTTYERWAASVPQGFRFSVKAPKSVTHERRLVGCEALLERFVTEIAGLGDRLGVVLVQLPPSLPFERGVAEACLRWLRDATAACIVLEPRHPSWFTAAVDTVLVDLQVARVGADPAPVPTAAHPGGWPGLVYLRLHGSPRMYYSSYEVDALDDLRRRLEACARSATPAWCIFDNTAAGAAIDDALWLKEALA